ncbi:hypothetical protein KKJ01_14155 [Xenorhabdus bovienii]|uniref:Uncharacterized protein n=1 Tax=Xenorhabdus bovienii TaxID=40576 RepID=A0AAJ1J8Z1_XENBV|nr:hypothetical protein [Xenorhabdus bovienii]MDE1479342.1 hypothetical protein [Xenorhabdus bovienii]MDE9511021.1 hypothetical protein [Xenorhabdus bovienii]MDE9522678.1 hypothetical protein [Xenorhabdus bovienii]
MKFEELPEAVQLIAAHALRNMIERNDADKEQAKEMACSISKAFTALYEDN